MRGSCITAHTNPFRPPTLGADVAGAAAAVGSSVAALRAAAAGLAHGNLALAHALVVALKHVLACGWRVRFGGRIAKWRVRNAPSCAGTALAHTDQACRTAGLPGLQAAYLGRTGIAQGRQRWWRSTSGWCRTAGSSRSTGRADRPGPCPRTGRHRRRRSLERGTVEERSLVRAESGIRSLVAICTACPVLPSLFALLRSLPAMATKTPTHRCRRSSRGIGCTQGLRCRTVGCCRSKGSRWGAGRSPHTCRRTPQRSCLQVEGRFQGRTRW